MSRDEMQAVLERVMRLKNADRLAASLSSSWTGNTRFAANQMSTSGSVENTQLGVTAWFENRRAGVSTNDFSDTGLEAAVRKAEALAKISPADPEDMPLLGPQTYQPVPAYFDRTATSTAEDRARAAMSALELARKAGDLETAGFLIVNAFSQAIANSAGLFAYHRTTGDTYTVTVRTKDGTGAGWAGADNADWAKLDFTKVAQRAIEKARASRNPVAIEPGRYTVILEAQAVGDLVQLLGGGFGGGPLSARSADEGRSPFTKEGGGNKIGEKVVDERVTLISDPQDPDLLGQPFDGEGFPLGRQAWIENGVLKKLAYTRFWAQKQGKQPTGSSSTIKLLGGATTQEEMVRSTDRGVLVTRLWYLRQVDPRTVLYTGLTRDGTFLIEGGKVSRAIKNFRFNESPLFMLNNLETLGPTERLAGAEGGGDIVMPPIKVRDFNFTSLSDAV
ncbi:MAG: TldD/PmbA family protein [Gemmatimonadetes bacterium]|nr:TldD/PmbA family protein [Gemmatimonadota bacterium]